MDRVVRIQAPLSEGDEESFRYPEATKASVHAPLATRAFFALRAAMHRAKAGVAATQ